MFSSLTLEVFPDDYIHLGGDEVPFDCWQSNPDIQKWMSAHHYRDYSLLEQYYETQLLNIVGKIGKQYIIWEVVNKRVTLIRGGCV